MSAVNATAHDALPVNIVHGTHSQLILFLVLNMWPSHFGLPLLLSIVLLSKRVKRHATFVNLCVVFIITGISSSLLLYAGKITGSEPSRMLCLLQSSLLYGMPCLTSTAALTLVLQMYFTIRAAYNGQEYREGDHFLRVWILLSAPYIAYFIAILATASIGAMDPTRVSRNRRFFYCSLENLPLTNTLTIYSAIILFATFVMSVWTMVLLYRRMMSLKALPEHLRSNASKLDLSFPLRIITFGFYIIIAMSLSLLSVTSPSSPAPDLVIASEGRA
ncbi:hypothetical protein D9613_005429 [Agrocybe pediades]|uniref:Uncharacterized protein n=1 Tax=Agrocybe pediades TaxID=84607 RepID=A0A8H4VR73_9AGAR|nr:hypothetical protein D9613_005429 [Agrocybe pediades]